MTLDLLQLLHQTAFGAVAAVGFGVLFNMAPRALPWCALMGGLALMVRTLGIDAGWSLEAASFIAAVAVGCGVQVLYVQTGIARNALAVAGCIPMVPGSFAAKAILGMFALTAPLPEHPDETIVMSVEYGLRVLFTFGAIGAGLTIPTHLLGRRDL